MKSVIIQAVAGEADINQEATTKHHTSTQCGFSLLTTGPDYILFDLFY